MFLGKNDNVKQNKWVKFIKEVTLFGSISMMLKGYSKVRASLSKFSLIKY